MRFHWMAFVILFYLFCYHSKGNQPVRQGKKVPIVFNFADEGKRNTLVKRQNKAQLEMLNKHEGFSLQILAHGVEKHMGNDELLTHINDTIEYIPEEEEGEPTQHGQRVKRWGQHHQHYQPHQHHQHHQHYQHHQHHQHHQHKPVSLDFGCNSDNYHEHLTKQHDASGSSDGTTSAPSSSSSDDHQPLSVFIKRPHHQQRPHHHGPHLTFRCNAHNHHIFKHFRRSSK